MILYWTMTISLVFIGQAIVPSLTLSNFDRSISGKGAFIKFFTPWCSHCKSMAPAWEKLSIEFKDVQEYIIAEVDCSLQKVICDRHGITEFPALKYFTGTTPAGGLAYTGSRDVDSLRAFAKRELAASCSWERQDLCDDQLKADLFAASVLNADELRRAIADIEAKLEASEQEYEDGRLALKARHEASVKDKTDVISRLSPILKAYRLIPLDYETQDLNPEVHVDLRS
jgi:thiol-disulfide isomerase/thioredoxin